MKKVTKEDLKGKIAVLGLGLEGLSSAKFLKDQGALVTVFDKRTEKEIDPKFIKALEKLDVSFYGGADYLDRLTDFNLISRSPGIRYLDKSLQKIKEKGIQITSQTKLFFDLCPGKIIGVSGTKGKGTTASLIYEMLKKEGKDAYLVGNIGLPPLEVLNNLNGQSIVVFELSSFQLQDLHKSPHIAVLLMMTSEHLDYHQNVEEYVDAKRNILRFQTREDFAVLNHDYPESSESDIHTEGKAFKVSRIGVPMDDGAFIKDNAVWLKLDGKETKLIDTKDILLPGGHNLENICSAVVAASLSGVSKESVVSVLKNFQGLEHRLELVDTIRGVRYYDDSFSTTPETAIAAIEAFDDPEILILGGSSKNSDFTDLGFIISNSQNIKAIIGIGIEWEKIKDLIRAPKSEILLVEGSTSMEQVVLAASKIADVGDIVILSPACASFGMFKNYKDRGEQFKQEVRKLRMTLN